MRDGFESLQFWKGVNMTVKKFADENEFREWIKENAEPGMFGPLLGASPGGAASELNVSRQMIHKMIRQGKLDALKVYRGGDYEGQAREIYITNDSLNAEKRRRGLAEDDKELFEEGGCGADTE